MKYRDMFDADLRNRDVQVQALAGLTPVPRPRPPKVASVLKPFSEWVRRQQS